MRRSLLCSSRKGQWFIIAAIIASGVFLTISVVFKSFAATDASRSATGSEEFYFWSVQKTVDDILATGPSGCQNLTEAVNEFRSLSEKQTASLGYFLFLNVTLNTADDCSSREADVGVLIASSRTVLHKNVDPKDVISGIFSS